MLPEEKDLSNAVKLVNAMEQKRQADPNFEFRIHHNDRGQLDRIYWITNRQKEQLKLFDDVLVIDTTFK